MSFLILKIIRPIVFLSFMIFILNSCKKECGNNDDKTVKRLEGIWNVSEVQTNSGKLSNTGEKFTFCKCIGNNEFVDCKGKFITSNGHVENFLWFIKGNTFGIYGYDFAAEVSMYKDNMQSVKVCDRKKIVFNPTNILILEKEGK